MIEIGGFVIYYYIFFDEYEIIYVNGVVSESFYFGEIGLLVVIDEVCDELFVLFFELWFLFLSYGVMVWWCLKKYEVGLF